MKHERMPITREGEKRVKERTANGSQGLEKMSKSNSGEREEVTGRKKGWL